MYVMLTTIKKHQNGESADGAHATLNTPADDNEEIMIIVTSIWTLSKNPTVPVRVPSHPYNTILR